MKKSIYLLSIVSILLLAGCRGRGGSTSQPSSTSSGSSGSSVSSSQNPSSGSAGSSAASQSASSATSQSSSTSSSIQPAELTISAVKEKGEALKDLVPSGEHKYISDEVVTTKGRVIQAIDYKAYSNILIYIADDNDMMPVLSLNSSNTLYDKCKNHIGKDTSNYIITGKVGYYYSLPILEVTSFELKQDMTFDVDYSKYSSTKYESLLNYNEALLDVDYNHKGCGSSKLVTLENMTCVAKADDNSWLFSDRSNVQSVYHQTSNTAFIVGKNYDLFGISCVHQWRPSIRVLDYKQLTDSITVDIKSLATEQTAAQAYSLGAPTDDTEKSTATNNFIKKYRTFYKATVYFNKYTQSANGNYVVAGDTYQSSVSSISDAAHKKLFKFNNENYNAYTDASRVPVNSYIGVNTSVTMYYSLYQFTKADGIMIPQVYIFDDLID